MDLETALEIVRRYRGPVSKIGLCVNGEPLYILESTEETYLEKELVALAAQLDDSRSGQ